MSLPASLGPGSSLKLVVRIDLLQGHVMKYSSSRLPTVSLKAKLGFVLLAFNKPSLKLSLSTDDSLKPLAH